MSVGLLSTSSTLLITLFFSLSNDEFLLALNTGQYPLYQQLIVTPDEAGMMMNINLCPVESGL